MRWATGWKSASLKRVAAILPARAMPMAFEIPWPSGPVVASTPTVCPNSGCPGVLLPHWRNA